MTPEAPQVETIPLEAELHQIRLLHDGVVHEFDLITARVGWLLAGESFLFAAFAAAIAGGSVAYDMFRALVQFLAATIPVLGVLFATVVIIAIRAAHRQANIMKDQRDSRIENRLPKELGVTLVSSRSDDHKKGNLPARTIPWIVILFWIAAEGFVILTPWE